jgi:hypothetical protein
MKVFIATPIRDYVTAEYAQSLFYAGLDCKERGIEVLPHIIRNSCFIDVARSVLVRDFLKTDCTHMLFIDSDVGYESHAVAGLVQAGVPFCAGVYPKRRPGGKFPATIHEPQELKGPWLRADRVAAGFMCLERRVLEEMSNRAPICKASDGLIPMVFRTETEGTFIGEDYCFCDDYTKLYGEGVFDQPIWVYPDITFNHDGYVGNLHESLTMS